MEAGLVTRPFRLKGTCQTKDQFVSFGPNCSPKASLHNSRKRGAPWVPRIPARSWRCSCLRKASGPREPKSALRQTENEGCGQATSAVRLFEDKPKSLCQPSGSWHSNALTCRCSHFAMPPLALLCNTLSSCAKHVPAKPWGAHRRLTSYALCSRTMTVPGQNAKNRCCHVMSAVLLFADKFSQIANITD
jgi:hypothetical protein